MLSLPGLDLALRAPGDCWCLHHLHKRFGPPKRVGLLEWAPEPQKPCKWETAVGSATYTEIMTQLYRPERSLRKRTQKNLGPLLAIDESFTKNDRLQDRCQATLLVFRQLVILAGLLCVSKVLFFDYKWLWYWSEFAIAIWNCRGRQKQQFGTILL